MSPQRCQNPQKCDLRAKLRLLCHSPGDGAQRHIQAQLQCDTRELVWLWQDVPFWAGDSLAGEKSMAGEKSLLSEKRLSERCNAEIWHAKVQLLIRK